jgi:FkbM family methyltransferase
MKTLRKILRLVARKAPVSQDDFLQLCRGVIHVGANTGQERGRYAAHDLQVVWVEPIPSVFEALSGNLHGFPKQTAYQRLISDQDGVMQTLNISNNEGLSSSILDLAAHREIWPDVSFTSSITVESVTLSTFVREERIDLDSFDALVLDTQGAELLILKGGADILHHFRFIKVEVADFESYKGCCQLPDVDSFMKMQGLKQQSKNAFAHSPNGGTYYDVLYRREL